MWRSTLLNGFQLVWSPSFKVEITWIFFVLFPRLGNWSLISFLAFPLDQGGSSRLRAKTNMYQNLVNNVAIKIELEMSALVMFLNKKKILVEDAAGKKTACSVRVGCVPDLVKGQVFDM